MISKSNRANELLHPCEKPVVTTKNMMPSFGSRSVRSIKNKYHRDWKSSKTDKLEVESAELRVLARACVASYKRVLHLVDPATERCALIFGILK